MLLDCVAGAACMLTVVFYPDAGLPAGPGNEYRQQHYENLTARQCDQAAANNSVAVGKNAFAFCQHQDATKEGDGKP